MKVKRYLWFIPLILLVGYLFFFMGSGISDLTKDFSELPKVSNTYLTVFLPEKQKEVKPYKTYFSKLNNPVATFNTINNNYSIVIYKLNGTGNLGDMLHIKKENKSYSSNVSYKGIYAGSCSKILSTLNKQTVLKTIEIYTAPDNNITRGIKNDEYVLYKCSNQLSISFNNTDITDIYIEPNHHCKSELEMLFFKKDKDYYLVFGLPNGNTPNIGNDTLINFFIPIIVDK